MTHDEMITVITHHKSGGKIEYRLKADVTWKDAPSPWWDFDEFDYRAKPEPLAAWIIYNETAQNVLRFCGSSQIPTKLLLEYQRKYPDLQITLKKFVEVVE
jgi:hypothetical protein